MTSFLQEILISFKHNTLILVAAINFEFEEGKESNDKYSVEYT